MFLLLIIGKFIQFIFLLIFNGLKSFNKQVKVAGRAYLMLRLRVRSDMIGSEVLVLVQRDHVVLKL